jgi:ABC-type amino acid transport substrate-binding protein
MLQNPETKSNITSEMLRMVGNSPPGLIPMSSSRILSGLQAGTIDIGMCGYFVTADRLANFDFTSPFYFMSGLQAVIRKGADSPSIMFVLLQLMSTVDALAQLIAVILLLCVMVFGHLIAAVENLKLSKQEDFRDNYFEGTQDGMWFSIVVMSTVGFGDLVPRTTPGRFLAILWIFLSIALMAILFAIITANFSNLVLVPTRAVDGISSPYDLAPFTVGTALQYAQQKLVQRMPNMTLVKFAQNTQPDVFNSLLNNSIEVAVDRYEAIQYYNTLDETFKNKLKPVGMVFNQEGVGFGVKRMNATTPHPLLHLLSLAVADATRGNWQQAESTSILWFGDPTAATAEDPTVPDLEQAAVANVKTQTATALGVLFGIWIFIVLCLSVFRYPYFAASNHICQLVKASAGITEMAAVSVMKAQALAGLKELSQRPEFIAAQEPEGICPPVEAVLVTEKGSMKEPAPTSNAPRYRASHYIQYIAKQLVTTNPRTNCWHRVTLLDYGRKARKDGRAETVAYELVRSAFFESYKAVEALIDDWKPPSDDMMLSLDDIADVVLDIASREASGWFMEGGLFFPNRSIDTEKLSSDRAFEQVANPDARRLRGVRWGGWGMDRVGVDSAK